jgi:hypothetical protein
MQTLPSLTNKITKLKIWKRREENRVHCIVVYWVGIKTTQLKLREKIVEFGSGKKKIKERLSLLYQVLKTIVRSDDGCI